MSHEPYNPLDKLSIARSIEMQLLARMAFPLKDTNSIKGAGVYAIYYTGNNPAYTSVAQANNNEKFGLPIYIGKAIPKGGRKGGLGAEASKGRALADRLSHHAASIAQVADLKLKDFWVRHLVLEDVWIPLGENMLIETFRPAWNLAIDGFGNKDPGNRRKTQYKSPWDVLHPGRKAMEKLADSSLTKELLLTRLSDHFAGRPLTKLPKAVARQVESDEEEIQENADDAAL